MCAAALTAAGVVLLSGCATEVIDNTRLEERIGTEYEKRDPGSTVESVRCPDDIPREPGTTATCRLTLASGVTGTIEVEVRDDRKVAWHVATPAPG
ncbi:UNVERIFIED_CONTAM: hypothetical protein LK11_37765 [Mumia flava]